MHKAKTARAFFEQNPSTSTNRTFTIVPSPESNCIGRWFLISDEPKLLFAGHSVTIGKATSIGKWAFEDCDSLRSVTIGKAAAIGNAAFAKIGSSCTVSYNGSASAWSHLGFEFSPNLVLSDTILYISAAHGSKHSEVHTTDGTIEVAASVSALAKQYGRLFLRCHHSHLVNPDYIQNIRRFKVTLSDGTELPIPEKKYTAFREQCQKRS